MSPKILYPEGGPLKIDPEIFKILDVEACPYNVKQLLPAEHIDAEMMVTWCNSKDMLKDAAQRMQNIKWIQSLAAGPNDVINAGFDKNKITITSGSGLHNTTVAEHTLGLLLVAARRFHEMRDFQTQSKWPAHLAGAEPDQGPGRFTSLNGARILIWGFGNIGKTLAPWLQAMGANVRGAARTAGTRDGIEVVDDSGLNQALSQTDALVTILPGMESTKHALNRERLRHLPKHAWVVNVGRGSTVDEDALVEALNGEEIGGAALDVFATEPLPAKSALWKAKNCFISPHAAGNRPRGADELIASNLRKYLAGQELTNVI